MRPFLLIAPLLLAGCATPVAQPVASTDLGRAPPLIASGPLHGTVATDRTMPSAAPPPTVPPPPPPQPQPASKVKQHPPLPPATPAELAIAKSNRAFAVSLYRQLATKPGNVFISPISIAGAFGPVAAGARGQTRAEIGKVLHFPADDKVLSASLGGILRTLESDGEGHQVNIANALWPGTRFPIEPNFIELAKRSYDADVEALDFADSATAAARINNWVDRKTNSRIPQLFEPDAFDVDTALVITNAVYFLGEWQESFDPRWTKLQPFYLADGTTRNVPMMSAGGMRAIYLGAGEVHPPADAVELLELPYKGDRLSMVVILPQTRDGLPAVEAGLSAAKLDKWLESIDSAKPYPQDELQLPRMQFESKYELVNPLKALGMRAAFDAANFRGISKIPLFIDAVVHKTFLKVDEKGTEAAAATGIVISGERDHWEFRANHPFLFLIRDKQTGAILFLGRFAGP